MDTDSFGSGLRRAREKRCLSLRDIAGTTKIPCSMLEHLEASNLDELPADVFVRGFIRSFAKVVGIDENEPMHGFERALNVRRKAEQARASTPAVVLPPANAVVAAAPAEDDASSSPRRGGLGLAVFVIILLLIATITLSLLLRRPPQSGEGLSDATGATSQRPIVAEAFDRGSI